MNVAPFTCLSLFTGAGGLDLAVRIALPTAKFICHVEHEITACEVLAAHIESGAIEDAPIYSDVSSFDGRPWRGVVDCIVGGFPCTDLSVAGKRAGIDGEHSGLWWEFARIIREVQPGFVFIENVPPVLALGPGSAVLGELAALGFNAEWITLRASDVGASHQRKRVFILGYMADISRRRRRELWQSSWIGGLAGGAVKKFGGLRTHETTIQEVRE